MIPLTFGDTIDDLAPVAPSGASVELDMRVVKH